MYQQPAPLLVPLAEEGWIDGEVPVLAARRYLAPLAEAKIQVLMLGCTHYPLLDAPIRQALAELRCGAEVVDSATAMAGEVARTLDAYGIARPPGSVGSLDCYVTDLPASFQDVASRFLGTSPAAVTKVDIT